MTRPGALPADSPHFRVRSMEPLVSPRGASGVSYFTVLAAPTPETYARTDTSIWVLALGRDPQVRIVRRVDDGGVTGGKEYRREPETSSGRARCSSTTPWTRSLQGVQSCTACVAVGQGS